MHGHPVSSPIQHVDFNWNQTDLFHSSDSGWHTKITTITIIPETKPYHQHQLSLPNFMSPKPGQTALQKAKRTVQDFAQLWIFIGWLNLWLNLPHYCSCGKKIGGGYTLPWTPWQKIRNKKNPVLIWTVGGIFKRELIFKKWKYIHYPFDLCWFLFLGFVTLKKIKMKTLRNLLSGKSIICLHCKISLLIGWKQVSHFIIMYSTWLVAIFPNK